MHIAFLFSWDGGIPPDANNVKVYHVANALVRRGQSVTWVRMSNRDSYVITNSGIIIRDLAPLRIPRLSKLSFLLKVVLLFLKNRVDAVFIDCWLLFRGNISLMLLFQIIMKITRIRVIYDARDPFPEYEIVSHKFKKDVFRVRFIRLLSGIMYRLSDVILAPSKECKDFLVDNYNIDSSKVYSIYRGTDTEIFNPRADGRRIRMMLGLNNKFVVGWFGIMSSVQSIRELVSLIKTSQNVPDIVFLIAGKGPLKSDLVRLIEENPELPVLYLGYIPYYELPNYIASCDVTLCKIDDSTFYGRFTMPVKISESLATGVPVIANRTVTIANYFRHFKGVLFVDNTVEHFLKALLEVRNNPETYKSVAVNESTKAELSLQEASRKISDIILTSQKLTQQRSKLQKRK